MHPQAVTLFPSNRVCPPGGDLIGVQNLTKKHQAVVAEINNHEPRIAAVLRDADDLVTEGHLASDEVRTRAAQLTDQWQQLKEKAAQRRQDLDASLAAHQVSTERSGTAGRT